MKCDVVETLCAAPANGVGHTSARCHACGLPACPPCSRRTRWHDRARVRVCFTCLTDDGRGAEVAQTLWTRAGYIGTPPDHVVEVYTSHRSGTKPLSLQGKAVT